MLATFIFLTGSLLLHLKLRVESLLLQFLLDFHALSHSFLLLLLAEASLHILEQFTR